MCIVYKKYRGLSRKRDELENGREMGFMEVFYREEKEGLYGERRMGNIVSESKSQVVL